MPFLAPVFGFLAANAATIGTAALVGGGVAAASGAFSPKSEPSAPAPAPLPSAPELAPTPTTEDAKAKAAEEVAKQKRIKMLAGGKTLLSGEAPTLTAGGGKTLLGS